MSITTGIVVGAFFLALAAPRGREWWWTLPPATLVTLLTGALKVGLLSGRTSWGVFRVWLQFVPMMLLMAVVAAAIGVGIALLCKWLKRRQQADQDWLGAKQSERKR